jgi:hypothetical protein
VRDQLFPAGGGFLPAIRGTGGAGRPCRLPAIKKPTLVAMKIDQSGYARTAADSALPPAELAALRMAISPAAATFAIVLTISGDDEGCVPPISTI